MNEDQTAVQTADQTAPQRSARDWVQVLAKYRDPSLRRSVLELVVTLVPFVLLWGLAWAALSVSYLLAFAIALLNGAFLVRIFIIQHDCGHASYFQNRRVSDWIGRGLGVLTLTPYDVWKRTHSIHHSHHGNLDQRGIGDVLTLTVAEYRARSAFGRLVYRVYRHPLVLFVLGPSYLFILQNRLPLGLMKSGWRYWTSAMGTNAMIAIGLALIIYLGGLMPVLLIYLPTSVIAATIGVWLFYVQHQFEETHWAKDDEWQLHEAALEGSSELGTYYILLGKPTTESHRTAYIKAKNLLNKIPRQKRDIRGRRGRAARRLSCQLHDGACRFTEYRRDGISLRPRLRSRRRGRLKAGLKTGA